jgi:LysR family transcriptional regulator, glycine cleavage system transcriptional activator
MRTPANLPPFPALRAFEAVGRLLSFREASEELCITQSAVSYHIKTLEDDLGLKLFTRHGRGISFTPEGKAYCEVVRQALGLVLEGTTALRRSTNLQTIRVSALPSFAACWLVQRLPKFFALWPRLRVSIDPCLELVDLNAGDADLAIRYGRGDWPGIHSQLLIAEHLAPIASPTLLRSGPPIDRPQDILKHTLLFVRPPSEWQLWAEHIGVDITHARSLQLTEYNIVVQAAADGLGIAMGRKLLVAGRLRAGSLVQPLAESVSPSSWGYWICRAQADRRRATQSFVDWLLQESRIAASP